MKKLILLFFLGVLFSVSTAQAQKQGFGIKAGINTTSSNSELVIGPHFGLYYNFMLSDNFGLQPELIYSIQSSNFPVNSVSSKRNISYFNVPVMAKVYVANGFNLQFGPYIGFLASVSSDDDADVSLKANYRGTDYGVALGAAYEFPAGFNLGARYNLGLADISENDVKSQSGTVSVNTKDTNQFFQFYLGYTF